MRVEKEGDKVTITETKEVVTEFSKHDVCSQINHIQSRIETLTEQLSALQEELQSKESILSTHFQEEE